MRLSVELTESESVFFTGLSTFSGTTSFLGETFGSSGCFTLSHAPLLESVCFSVRHCSSMVKLLTFKGTGTIISCCFFGFSRSFLWFDGCVLWLDKGTRSHYEQVIKTQYHILLRIVVLNLRYSTFDEEAGPENAEYSFLRIWRPPFAFIDLKDNSLWIEFTDQIIPEFDTYGEFLLNKHCYSICNELFTHDYTLNTEKAIDLAVPTSSFYYCFKEWELDIIILLDYAGYSQSNINDTFYSFLTITSYVLSS